ncbi:chemokine (C-C motif) ligand 34a, duplicate 3 [Brienomyrus brachyistius]|uniref:chemokine (C-C motif) ligand 34a, duplicate 3 n=1 Tax=Brienomyrus brachyistius TaxID=42636 RepID=UPI0020B369EB|nr:chemokine (C-C motif) ligand 34a, duplicate 3 [Brienomyrus brachyistius]
MSPSRRLTSYLVVLSIVVAIMAVRTDGDEIKVTSCCTTVSKKKITSPILGYRTQKWNPPCVKAVIFDTEDGPVCSHWKEEWVFRKVKELETARRTQITTAPTSRGV